ncbi:hypothetical protein OH77DRAFT_1472893 [Trametes cingulata]|nr:hypothetical protein OH77DRAFT_1472893 [Trametes cingulata]
MFPWRASRSRILSTVPSSQIDDATKQALLAVVQVWLDRLQTMAVVTTFFVSIDSMLYGYASAALPPDSAAWSSADLLKTATLGGAIILHVCASILAYLASFVLIRYRLDDAEEQVQVAEHPSNASPSTKAHLVAPASANARRSSISARSEPVRATSRDFRSLVSVYQVRPLEFMYRSPHSSVKTGPEAPDTGDAAALCMLQSMIKTLTRCHTVVAILSNVGFVLALVGTLAYFWTSLPIALGSFASVCLGLSFFGGVYAIM